MAASTEKQIIFTGSNVVGIREDRKTQTRRIVTPHNSFWDGHSWPKGIWEQCRFDEAWIDPGPSPAGNEGPYLKVPRTEPESGDDGFVHRVYPRWWRGDTLWVRESWQLVRESGHEEETWWEHYEGKVPKESQPKGWLVAYRGTDSDLAEMPWRSSLHMPRWACRERLTVTNVRVERLQSITEEDARAEGFTAEPMPCRINGKLGTAAFFDPIRWYVSVWDTINRKTPWLSNPWVWCITFERQQQ